MPKPDQVGSCDKPSLPASNPHGRDSGELTTLVVNEYKRQIRMLETLNSFVGWKDQQDAIRGVIGDCIDPPHLLFGPIVGRGQYQANPGLAQHLSHSL